MDLLIVCCVFFSKVILFDVFFFDVFFLDLFFLDLFHCLEELNVVKKESILNLVLMIWPMNFYELVEARHNDYVFYLKGITVAN